MIVGNVEEYIERCLKSFLPIADEVCLVRAIGNQLPDETYNIADKVCTDAGVPLVFGNYKNKPGHETWPHVDDFAAARQQSFDMATGDYCFWCDSDDVLSEGADVIRERANRAEYSAYLFPYDIFGRGINLARERMTIRGGGKWVSPVHEYYQFPFQVDGLQDDRVTITHLPHTTKKGSNSRNLTILESIPESEMNCGLWYHLHGELAGTARIPEAIEAAKRALSDPKIGRPEKYELFLNLSRLATGGKVKEGFLHAAYAADPNRREALGMLTCNSLDYGHNTDALAYARQMMATVKPKDESWNDRGAAYDWLGIEIYTQALRVNGLKDQAEAIRSRALQEAGGPMIALIHATRGRPQQASVAKKNWYDLAHCPQQIEHIFVIDEDDKDSEPLKRMHHLVVPKGGGCVAAWNQGAVATTAPIIIQLSDDWNPMPQWDKHIVERLGDLNEAKVLAVSDGVRQDQLLCMAICTRNYMVEDQFLFHPDFLGVYSDNWFTEQAYKRNAVIEARDLVFTHSHPAFGSADVDETYAVQNSPERYAQGLEVLKRLQSGTDWSSCPGFFNYWGLYDHIATKAKDGDTIVEVGCWMGRSITYLAQRLQRLGKKVNLYAVDTFVGELNQPAHGPTVEAHGGSLRAAFESNLKRCGVSDMVTIIEGDSADSAARFKDGEAFFVFIDAAHDYDSVKRDVSAWLPKVRKDGILAGHDANYEPVEKAVKELIPAVKLMGAVWLK